LANVTLLEICDAIEDVLEHATGLVRSQSTDELQDAPQDLPCLQICPASGNTDAMTQNSRYTFKSVRRMAEMIVNADVLCRQRSHLDLDVLSAITMQDTVQQLLEGQKTKPFFGNSSIQDFWWSWALTEFVRGGGGGEVRYYGVRFEITVRVG
jgi:hypothetical protein